MYIDEVWLTMTDMIKDRPLPYQLTTMTPDRPSSIDRSPVRESAWQRYFRNCWLNRFDHYTKLVHWFKLIWCPCTKPKPLETFYWLRLTWCPCTKPRLLEPENWLNWFDALAPNQLNHSFHHYTNLCIWVKLIWCPCTNSIHHHTKLVHWFKLFGFRLLAHLLFS